MDKLSWCSAMKTGSGDCSSQDENQELHRYNHIIQIKLVSPFLFSKNEYDQNIYGCVRNICLSSCANKTEDQTKTEWSIVKLFVEVYRLLRGIMPDIPNDGLREIENELRQYLEDGDLSVIETNQKFSWFNDLCNRVRCGGQLQVLVVVIACLHFMVMESPDSVVQSFDDQCCEAEQKCKPFVNQADEQFNNKSYQKALAHYTFALSIHPLSHELYSKRSRTHLKMENNQQAEDDALKAIFLKCDWAQGYLNLLEAVGNQDETELPSLLSEEAVSRCRTTSQSNDLLSLIFLHSNNLKRYLQTIQCQMKPEIVSDSSDDSSEKKKTVVKTRKKRSRIKSDEWKKNKENAQTNADKNMDKWKETTRQASSCFLNRQYTSARTLYADALNQLSSSSIIMEIQEKCRNPPKPEAICRYKDCIAHGHVRNEIYLSDPDCKGYVKILCRDGCYLEYHPNCWKSLKEELDQTNDKDCLNLQCLTPDCLSEIVTIIHVNNQGKESKKIVENVTEKNGQIGIKQKRSKFEKKTSLKEKKKRKKVESKTRVRGDSVNETNDGQEITIQKTEEVQKRSSKEIKPTISAQFDSDLDLCKFAVLKRSDEDLLEAGRKIERHKEKKKDKRKQILTLDEFLHDNNSTDMFSMSNEYMQRLVNLKAAKDMEQNKLSQLQNSHELHNQNTGHLWTENSGLLLADDRMFEIWQQDEPYRIEMFKKSKRDQVVHYVKRFLRINGPTHIHNINFLNELSSLPIDIQEMIATEGGIELFLKDNDDFFFSREIIALAESLPNGNFYNTLLGNDKKEAEEELAQDSIKDSMIENNDTSSEDEGENCDSDDMQEVTTASTSIQNPKTSDFDEPKNSINSPMATNVVPQVENQEKSEKYCSKLQRLWRFVPKFSEKGQKFLLYTVIKTVIEENILERYSAPGDNVKKTVVSFKYAIDALRTGVENATQTDFEKEKVCDLEKQLAETKIVNEDLLNKIKDREALIQHLLKNENQVQWAKEKKNLEDEILSLKQALEAAEMTKKRMFDQFTVENKKINHTTATRLTRSASVTRPKINLSQETSKASVDKCENWRFNLSPTVSTGVDGIATNKYVGTVSATQVDSNAHSSPTGKNSFEKLMLTLESKFPYVTRSEIERHVKELRRMRSNNTLTGLTLDQIVQHVSKIIEFGYDQATFGSKSNLTLGAKSMGLDRISEPGSAWHLVSRDNRPKQVLQIDDDFCAICQDSFQVGVIRTLQCLHRFHELCIKKWFKQENTCPTCRCHCLLPDEFPSL